MSVDLVMGIEWNTTRGTVIHRMIELFLLFFQVTHKHIFAVTIFFPDDKNETKSLKKIESVKS